MPDTQKHRGAHPEDARLFAPDQLPALRAAVSEFSWLLTRGYAPTSSLKLVGDRHTLNTRQRIALSRAACSDQQRAQRRLNCLELSQIQGEEVLIDGFNLLISVEAALSGGVLLRCRDGCLRDLASVHGSYRAVSETPRAILLIGEALRACRPAAVQWLFDAPVSNSGRMAQRIRSEAASHGWPWSAEVVLNPDRDLMNSAQIAVSSDSLILDHVGRWVNLGAYMLARLFPDAWIVDVRERDAE